MRNPFKRRSPEGEARQFYNNRIPTWQELTGGYTYAGEPVTLLSAAGVTAVGRAIRLVSSLIAQLPLNVYRGRGDEKRLADNTWQYRLLAELPGMGDFTPYDLMSDIVASVEGYGNAFVYKVKAAGEVIALVVLDPERVDVKRENGEKVFYVREPLGPPQRYTLSSVIHIRGFTLNGADVGVSPIALHRQKLAAILGQDRFHARFFGQGTQTNLGIEANEPWSKDQAVDFRTSWMESNAGGTNAHLPAVVWNAKFAKLGMSLVDAQFVEGAKLNMVEIANMFDLPAKFLTGGSERPNDLAEVDFIGLYQMSIGPRLRRIEMALFADPDLFPQRIIYPEFDVRRFFRTDAKTQAEVAHMQIQDGSLLVDEYRAELGRPPLPGGIGQVPQVTPVGGAPNPDSTNPLDEPALPTAEGVR
jgi:HK97 family phage portal protein